MPRNPAAGFDGCQEVIFCTKKILWQNYNPVKSRRKYEKTVTILCQSIRVQKFGKGCEQLLWINLWRMWKTRSYQQVFGPLPGGGQGRAEVNLVDRIFKNTRLCKAEGAARYLDLWE